MEVNLEEGAEVVGGNLATPDPPAETPKPAEQAPLAAAAPPNQEEEGDPEGTVVTPQGKLVPIGAVIAERGRRKEVAKAAAEKDTLIQQLKAKADQFDQVEGYLRQAQPIIETIRQNPKLVELAKNPPQEQAPAGPLSAQEAIDYAKDFDLYKPDGTPDVERAQRIAARHESLADRRARQAVAPIYQNHAQQQSYAMRNAIIGLKDEQGNAKFDPQALDEVWKLVPPEESAKPEVANALAIMSLGLSVSRKGAPRQAPAAPIVTESLGGGKPGAPTLSSVGERMQQASGLSRKDYLALRETVTDGPNVLE